MIVMAACVITVHVRDIVPYAIRQIRRDGTLKFYLFFSIPVQFERTDADFSIEIRCTTLPHFDEANERFECAETVFE